MKRKILPYNPKLKDLARKLRKNMTFSEVKMWQLLKQGKIMGYDFDRQKPIANYIVDFFCKDLQLAVEIDGITHEEERAIVKDAARQKELEAMGVNFIRIDAMLVINKEIAALKEIERWIEAFEKINGVNENVLRWRKTHL